MSCHTLKPNISIISTDNHPSKLSTLRNIENYILIWLDSNINEFEEYYRKSINELQHIVNVIYTFSDVDQCVDFLTDIEHEKVFMIISNSLDRQVVPAIENVSQIDSIYILSNNNLENKMNIIKWTKVKGMFSQIDELCKSLKRDTRSCEYNMISISILRSIDSSNRDLNELDQSFMYSQLLKEILLDMNYDDDSKKKLVDFCRHQYYDSASELKIIDEFDQEYHKHSPIWWYTRECFTYHMLNRALRTQDIEVIINMRFFLLHVHEQIRTLHAETPISSIPSTVYRGQGMSKTETEVLKVSKGGLLSFNSFLSTSVNRELSLLYAESAAQNPDLDGVLFRINIDPTINVAPFASVNEHSYYGHVEEEILFSMHTVFRIGDIKLLENKVLEIDLTLTTDDDPQLRILTDFLRKEISTKPIWMRLAHLLEKMGKFDKADEIYQMQHRLVLDDDVASFVEVYVKLGRVKQLLGDYKNALSYFEKAVELVQQNSCIEKYIVCQLYVEFGLFKHVMEDYSAALTLFQKAQDICEEYFSSNPVILADIYHNLGLVYHDMHEYSKSLLFYEKSLEISEKYLPENHIGMSNTYNGISQTYRCLGEYSTAISFLQKVLVIRLKTLPPDHPAIATIYNNIGVLYSTMKDFPNALSFLQKALEILQKSSHLSHSNLGSTYYTIGLVYKDMGEYSNALILFQKAHDIYQKSLPPYHASLAKTHKEMASMYCKTKNYAKALTHYMATLEIAQTIPTYEDDQFLDLYISLAKLYSNMKDHTNALKFYQKILEFKKKLGPNYYFAFGDDLKAIGEEQRLLGNYSDAISSFKQALVILLEWCGPKQPKTTFIYKRIGMAYNAKKDYSNALSYFHEALENEEKSVPRDESGLSATYNNLGHVHINLGEYSIAMSYLQKALITEEKIIPQDCHSLISIHNNLGSLYALMGDYSMAISFFEKALAIHEKAIVKDNQTGNAIYVQLANAYALLGHNEMALLYAQRIENFDLTHMNPYRDF
jgi:tetratricopeptide (TPR) repeat protein